MGAEVNVPYAWCAVRYSRWERAWFWLFGRWPRDVVERRTVARAIDDANARNHWLNHLP